VARIVDDGEGVEREAERVLAERHPERSLRANGEFYTAVLLEAIGIPRTLFSPTFAASRVVGWCAHVDNRSRRPAHTASLEVRGAHRKRSDG